MNRRYTIRITMLTSLVAGMVGIAPALKAGDAPESDSVSKLLADAKTQSYAISVDASILESYTRQPSLAWQTHAIEITRMKEDINAAAKTVGKLNDARGQAAPWQAAAIDRIMPYMKEIADDTTAAIEYLNKNQSKPLIAGDYRDYIEANSDTSHELSSMIADFVDYGNTRTRYESLRKKLELPAK